MLYALICTDKPDSVDLRLKERPGHIDYLNSLGARLKAAGPFTDEAGSPIGSLVIVEAKDRAGAEEVAKNDPYAKAGLFAAVEIRAWTWGLKNPEVK
ncbi:MAG: YciI family protein [Parvibaculaceae bacterium]